MARHLVQECGPPIAAMCGVGQYVYVVDAPWVRVDERRQILPEEMPRLHAVLHQLANSAMSHEEPARRAA